MILTSDPLVIPQPGFRSDFVGWSDPTRSDRARYRIHRPGQGFVPFTEYEHCFTYKTDTFWQSNSMPRLI